jgi:hypothetical protein
LKLFERLVGAQPLHASPAEHQATPDVYDQGKFGAPWPDSYCWEKYELHGNFRGWIQYRKTLHGEFVAG